jgi:hypothetical protein
MRYKLTPNEIGMIGLLIFKIILICIGIYSIIH